MTAHTDASAQWWTPWRIVAAVALVVIVFVACAALVLAAPIEAYYDSPYMSYLNGSTGAILLEDGEAWMLNTGGETGPSNELLGNYTVIGPGLVVFSFADSAYDDMADKPTRITIAGFSWKDIMGEGRNFNDRIVSPARLRELRAIPKGTPPAAIP